MFKTFLAMMLVSLMATTALAGGDPPAGVTQTDVHAGPVMGVMTDAIMIMDERDNIMETIAVTPQTKVMLNGQTASLIDIQMGDQVTVTAKFSEEKLTAITINAMRRL
jgi:hypothetical protein